MRYHIHLILFLVASTSCQNKTPEKISPTNESDESLTGLELSKQYCSSCHLYPEPTLLTTKTWEKYILPRMGYMLGIYGNDSVRFGLIEAGKGGELVEAASIFPNSPLISDDHWSKIRAYYMNESSDKLEPTVNRYTEQNQFKVIIPSYQLSPPSTTLTKFSLNGDIYLGDANSKSILKLDKNLNLIKTGKVPEGVVNLEEFEGSIFMTAMGSFSPTDSPVGSVIQFPESGSPKVLIDGLQRPVHSSFHDFDNNGLQDIVISEFGKWTGSLSLWKNLGQNQYREIVLEKRSGAIRTEILDLNNDGLSDIVALFGQGDEGIKIFYNEGKGNFTSEWLVRFPATYGSSYFKMYDFNGDGSKDIIYTAGDNGDYPPLMKPYHGIRILINKDNAFEESIFLPVNGCYKAIPFDFDNDGDIDIASISFFPDFQNTPDEMFVYFENDGKMNFQAQTIQKISGLGRWLVMDSHDWDKDGDLDLILGSLTFEVVPEMGFVNQWIQNAIPFVVLENNGASRKD